MRIVALRPNKVQHNTQYSRRFYLKWNLDEQIENNERQTANDQAKGEAI